TITINQMGRSTVEYAKRGASANEPTSVETEDKVALVNSPTEIKITTTSADRCRSQWVAVINTSKWRVTKVVDNDNDTVDFEEKAIGNYRVYHATSAGAINNTYTFTLTKI
ncbi:MAG: hypothetical protein Q4A08_09695, partial [Bacteroidales bacterium]|nr:hypothetical protein [Bacteroidales bacterium]